MTRALIAARKSTKVRKDGKASGSQEGHSLHTQDEHSRAFCERLGWEVVGVPKDTISGRVAPIDRKELGQWLADPTRFDVVVAYRSDRLSRGDQEDWTRIEHWATENAKALVIVDGTTGVRYPARDDSDFWQWTAMKREAGREWESIRERAIRSQAALVADGAFTGRPAFGYRTAGEKYAKRLEVFEPEAALVREVFERVTQGESLRVVAEWLTAASGRFWQPKRVAYMVNCWTYAGRIERNGTQYAECPPIVSAGELVRAQNAMRSRAKKNDGGRPSLEPALMVPVCGECGSKMYRQGRDCDTYYCSGRHGFGIPCDQADRSVMRILTSSDEDEMLPEVIRGKNWADEIETLKRDQRQALDRQNIDAVVKLAEQIKDLESRDVEPDRVELIPTGRTVGQAFEALSRDELRAALKAWNVAAYPDGRLTVKSPWEAP